MRIQLSSIKPETCKTVKILNNLFIKETTEIMIFFLLKMLMVTCKGLIVS